VSTESAERGHYYSHPSNKFWELLAATGLTNGVRLTPEDDGRLPQFGIGLTDVAKGRAASSDALLGNADYDVDGFLGRIAEARPAVVVFNGGEASRRTATRLRRRAPRGGHADWQIGVSYAYVLVSSSASASVGTERKITAWTAFGDWVRRQTPEWPG
jgi:TDG/mug DNA glycosylase family protein